MMLHKRERRRMLISVFWALSPQVDVEPPISVTRGQCDAYGYLPGRKASPPIGWYQIILLGDRGKCVLTTCPGLHSTAGRLGFEPVTY